MAEAKTRRRGGQHLRGDTGERRRTEVYGGHVPTVRVEGIPWRALPADYVPFDLTMDEFGATEQGKKHWREVLRQGPDWKTLPIAIGPTTHLMSCVPDTAMVWTVLISIAKRVEQPWMDPTKREALTSKILSRCPGATLDDLEPDAPCKHCSSFICLQHCMRAGDGLHVIDRLSARCDEELSEDALSFWFYVDCESCDAFGAALVSLDHMHWHDVNGDPTVARCPNAIDGRHVIDRSSVECVPIETERLDDHELGVARFSVTCMLCEGLGWICLGQAEMEWVP